MKEKATVFNKSNGNIYSSPSIVNAGGILIAAAVCSKTNKPWGYKEIHIKRSTNNGDLWEDAITVAAPPARAISDDEENTKTAFFLSPSMTVAPNGEIILLVTFFPESKGYADMKYLEKKKTACASFDGRRYPLIYDRDGNFYYVLNNGLVIDRQKSQTNYIHQDFGDLFKGEEYVGNIYLNGAKGKSSFGGTTTFGAALKAPKRSFIFMMKSSDFGKNWSEPVNITPQILNENDSAYLGISPGCGLTTSSGRIIFPLVTPKENACIYSDDNGKTWMRNQRIPFTGNSGDWSIIETPDKRLHAFCSGNLKQNVSSDNGILWLKGDKQKIKTPKLPKSVITFNGKVLISHPGNKKNEDGVLSVGEFIFDKRNRFKGISWKGNEINIKTGYFARSCITPVDETTVGVLYEDDRNGRIDFRKIEIK